MNATPRIIDFTGVDRLQHTTGKWRDKGIRPISPEGYRMSRSQIRKRLDRAAASYQQRTDLSYTETAVLYRKPVDEWDEEELARGRPRDKNGQFRGPKPAWVTAEIHESALERFQAVVRSGMRVASVDALNVLKDILNDEATDNRGKPVVSASTKLQAAQFLIEHIVGKPTQRIESDVSVKLQGILGAVMVNPDQMGGFMPGHLPGITMELATARDEDEDERSE